MTVDIRFLVSASALTIAALPLLAQAQVSSTSLADLSLQELLNIEITSVQRQPEPLATTPSALQVITREQIRRSGATTLAEVLRLASNLNVARQNSHEWIITARGFSSDVGNKLLVLIDGRSVYTPLFSGVFWDRQNYVLDDIERIEVISGPGGTQWGGNAVNGVINIITQEANDTQGLLLEAGIGTQLENLLSVRHGGRMGANTAYRVYGKTSHQDREFLSNGSEGRDAWEHSQIGFRIDQHRDDDHLTLQGDYYRGEAEVLSGGVSRISGANILGRWSREVDGGNLQVQWYYDTTQLKLPTAPFVVNGIPFAPAGEFEDRLDTADLDFQHSFALADSQQVTWGLSYRYMDNDVENSPALAFYPEKVEQELFGAFIQDEITLTDRLNLTLGTKVERNDYTGAEWSPSVRLAWQFSPNKLLWGAISRAVRIPSRLDRDLSQPSRDFLVILQGGENFDSEKLIAYEAGYRLQTETSLLTSVSVFYNDYDDVRSTSITPNTILPFFFENNLEGKTYGVELSVAYQPTDWWQVRMGYNFLEQSLRVKSGEFDFNNALNETADPKHQISLQSSLNLAKGIEIDAALRWVDDLPTNNAGQLVHVPDYAELDVRLGWHPKENLELTLVGRNLLNDHHQEFGVPGPMQEEVGRKAYAMVTWRF